MSALRADVEPQARRYTEFRHYRIVCCFDCSFQFDNMESVARQDSRSTLPLAAGRAILPMNRVGASSPQPL